MKFLLLLLLPFMAQAQTDTVSTPQVQNQINNLGAQRNYYYNLTQNYVQQIAVLQKQNDSLRTVIAFEPSTPDYLVNIHPFTNAAYSDLAAIVRDTKAIGFNGVRVDFHPSGNGLITNSTLYNNFLAAFAGSGLRIRPMVSLSAYLNQTYDATVADGQIFANAYPYDQYELHNESDNAAIVSGDGTKLTDYNPALIIKYQVTMKAFAEGIHKANPKAKITLDAAWTHFGFVQAMMAYGVPVDIYSQHWYTNQEKAYKGVPIEKVVVGLFPNQQITFNEVGLTPQSDGSLKSTDFPILQDLLTRFKPFGFAVNELYRELSRGKVEGNYGLYVSPGVPVPALVDIVKSVLK